MPFLVVSLALAGLALGTVPLAAMPRLVLLLLLGAAGTVLAVAGISAIGDAALLPVLAVAILRFSTRCRSATAGIPRTR